MKFYVRKSSLEGAIRIPASKSHTIRAVAVAAMADGRSVLRNPLESADARSAFRAAKAFGARIEEKESCWIIDGVGGKISDKAGFIDVANSGTTLRIFSALAALSSHPVTFDGDSSVRKRPMTPLLSALRNLGVKVQSEADNKCPFTVQGPIVGGKTTVNGISSQFLTALLFSTPLAAGDTEIVVENLHEKPYVEITLDWLRSQDIEFEQKGLDWFRVKGNQYFKAFDRFIPADFSSATFALCAAAITGSEVLIKGLDFTDHQGDKKVFDYMKKMGLKMEFKDDWVLVRRGELTGIDIDMNDTPDALPALAVVGCFAKGITRLLNVAQARLKECDRIKAMTTELKKMGAEVEELDDGMVIKQSILEGTNVHGYDDHRLVMALAVAGMAANGETIIDTAEAVNVTYPSFFDDIRALGAKLEK
ncbi:MAG: 3-phosphoshikimate 1-carboxyvinyltransferase [Bacteroidales bacterium]|nr:3-phosphoshikimate 1-carboxyvinyltransferase [Bacteroidales bacterium]